MNPLSVILTPSFFGDGSSFVFDGFMILVYVCIPFILLGTLFGMFFSFKYLKSKEDFSRVERLGITWITQLFIGGGLVAAYTVSKYMMDKDIEALIFLSIVLPFLMGVVGAAAAYWMFTLSRHRASIRHLLTTGVQICAFIYLGLPAAVTLVFTLIFIVLFIVSG